MCISMLHRILPTDTVLKILIEPEKETFKELFYDISMINKVDFFLILTVRYTNVAKMQKSQNLSKLINIKDRLPTTSLHIP